MVDFPVFLFIKDKGSHLLYCLLFACQLLRHLIRLVEDRRLSMVAQPIDAVYHTKWPQLQWGPDAIFSRNLDVCF